MSLFAALLSLFAISPYTFFCLALEKKSRTKYYNCKTDTTIIIRLTQ